MIRAIAAALLAAATSGCLEQTGPTMEPGKDCMTCHGEVAPAWTVAGTVFSSPDAGADAGFEGTQVLVLDSDGKALTLSANSSGNFYTAEPLAFPIRVELQRGNKRMAMSDSPPLGSCNHCHSPTPPEGESDVPGRLFVPQ